MVWEERLDVFWLSQARPGSVWNKPDVNKVPANLWSLGGQHEWVCGCEPHAWQADVLSSESVSGFSDRSKCWWLNPECGCMAVICDVLTSWQKEIASTTCLDSSRTHSQKSGKGGRGTGCLVYFLCALLLFVWFCNLRKGLEVELSLFKIMVFFPVSVVLQ